MKQQKGILVPVFFVLLISIAFSFNQPILYVKDNINNNGTHLELYDPGNDKTVLVTDATTPGLFNLSFPIVCETTGLIGFTNHTRAMAAEVYVIDPDSTTPRKAVDGAILEDISPDGKHLLVSGASSSPSLYLVDVSTHQLEQITKGYTVSSARFSPDGQSIVFGVMDKTGSIDIYKLELSNKEISPLIQTSQWSEYFPSFTQDGQYLMFMTNRTGQWGVDYVDMNTNKRYQANLWGMYPSLSTDDAWTALEKDGQILVSKTTGKEPQTLGEGSTPQWISLSAAGRFLGSAPVQVATTTETGKLL
ncbi:MAG: TolB family protein, partial [Thermotogota bacterium]